MVILHSEYGAKIEIVSGAHYGYNIIGGGLLVGIDDYGGLGILRFGNGPGNPRLEGVFGYGSGAYKKLLFVIYRYYYCLLSLGIAFGFGYTELYHIGISECGYDEEEQQQNE